MNEFRAGEILRHATDIGIAALKRPLDWLALIDGDADTIFDIDPRPQVNVQFLFHLSASLDQRNAYNRTAVIVEMTLLADEAGVLKADFGPGRVCQHGRIDVVGGSGCYEQQSSDRDDNATHNRHP